METFKFTIREKGELAKSLIRMLKEMAVLHDFIKEEGETSNALTKKTLDDSKTHRAKSIADLFDSI